MKKFTITITWKDGVMTSVPLRSPNILKAIAETVYSSDMRLDEDVKDIIEISAVIEKEV